MKKFKRERRYIVLKMSDVQQYLPKPLIDHLESIADEVNGARQMYGKPPLECVVVESDWPEYEPTWEAIQARVEGASHD